MPLHADKLRPPKKEVVVIEDMGGDAEHVLAALHGSDKYKITAVIASYGNGSAEHAARYLSDVLARIKVNAPVLAGATHALEREEQKEFGDGAHAATVESLSKSTKASGLEKNGVDFIIQSLRERLEQKAPPLTIIYGSSLTTLLSLLQQIQKEPELIPHIERIQIMGGCMQDIPAHDMDIRRGNVTPHAEFNTWADPKAAAQAYNLLAQLKIPTYVFPMEVTQTTSFTNHDALELIIRHSKIPVRTRATFDREFSDEQQRNQLTVDTLTELARKHGRTPEQLAAMITAYKAPEAFDQKKFNCASFMHDHHTVMALLMPENYTYQQGNINVIPTGEKKGFTELDLIPDSCIHVAKTITQPDMVKATFWVHHDRAFHVEPLAMQAAV